MSRICGFETVVIVVALLFIAVLASLSPVAAQEPGAIVGWGSNYYGECDAPEPNFDFVAVAAGQFFSLGLKSTGEIVAWGSDSYGVLEIPEPNADFVQIAAGVGVAIGRKQDGSLVCWGRYDTSQIPFPNTGFIDIAAGVDLLGLRTDGSIAVWGDLLYSGLANVPEPNWGYVQINANNTVGIARRDDGSVVTWGQNSDAPPEPNEGYIDIATGRSHALSLLPGGEIVAWGCYSPAACTVPEPNADFVGIAVGEFHSLGSKSDGQIQAWGFDNVWGLATVPAGIRDVVAASSYHRHNLVITTAMNSACDSWRPIDAYCNNRLEDESVNWMRDFFNLPIFSAVMIPFSVDFEFQLNSDEGVDQVDLVLQNVANPEDVSFHRLDQQGPARYGETVEISGWDISSTRCRWWRVWRAILGVALAILEASGDIGMSDTLFEPPIPAGCPVDDYTEEDLQWRVSGLEVSLTDEGLNSCIFHDAELLGCTEFSSYIGSLAQSVAECYRHPDCWTIFGSSYYPGPLKSAADISNLSLLVQKDDGTASGILDGSPVNTLEGVYVEAAGDSVYFCGAVEPSLDIRLESAVSGLDVGLDVVLLSSDVDNGGYRIKYVVEEMSESGTGQLRFDDTHYPQLYYDADGDGEFEAIIDPDEVLVANQQQTLGGFKSMFR